MAIRPNLYSLAKKITEDACSCSLKIDKTVKHPDRRKVKIIDGQYWGTYGLSNFWSWRAVLKNGALAKKIESGYGWM